MRFRVKDRYGRKAMYRAVVNLQNGRSFDGLIAHADSAHVLILGASIVDTETPVPVEGEVIVERDQIEFIQVVTPEVM